MNWYKTAQLLTGYKIVAWDGKRAWSLYGKAPNGTRLPYDITPGTIHTDLFLGTSEQFCKDYYLEMSQDHDMMLTYTYNPADIISGGGENSEVKVRKATLQSSRLL